jgi:hypothetical protein
MFQNRNPSETLAPKRYVPQTLFSLLPFSKNVNIIPSMRVTDHIKQSRYRPGMTQRVPGS